MTPWSEDAVRVLPDLVRLRRAIHSEPELGVRTPRMVIDDSIMARGAAVLAGIAARFLAGSDEFRVDSAYGQR
jgi:hypothetical protein